MPACLKSTILQTHRRVQQESERLDDLQKVIDEQTTKEFERYAARLKPNPRSRSYGLRSSSGGGTEFSRSFD